MILPSFTRCTSTQRLSISSSNVRLLVRFRYSRSVFSTRTTRHSGSVSKRRSMALNCLRPGFLADSTSTKGKVRVLNSTPVEFKPESVVLNVNG